MHPGCESMLSLCVSGLHVAGDGASDLDDGRCNHRGQGGAPPLLCSPNTLSPLTPTPHPHLSPLTLHTPHPLPLTPHSACTPVRWRSSPKWPASASTRLRSSSANSAGAATTCTCDRRAPALLPLPATAPLPQHTSTSGTATRAVTMTTTRCRRDRAAPPSPRSSCRSAAPVRGCGEGL